MAINEKHIAFRVLTFCLVCTLMFPAAFKFAHVFEHDQHEVCTGGNSTHIHKIDLDCEFHKFQLNTNFNISHNVFELFQIKKETSQIQSQYTFLSKYQHLHFSLRGPPSLV